MLRATHGARLGWTLWIDVVGDPTWYNTSQIEYLETQSFPIQTIVFINAMQTIG
jgi:hypothetical protein